MLEIATEETIEEREQEMSRGTQHNVKLLQAKMKKNPKNLSCAHTTEC